MAELEIFVAFLGGLVTGLILLPALRAFVYDVLDDRDYYGRDHLTGVEMRKRLFKEDDQ